MYRVTIMVVTGVATVLAYLFFMSTREPSIANKLQMIAVLFLAPCLILVVSVFRTRSAGVSVIAWLAILMGLFAARVEWGCRTGPDCGFFLVLWMIAFWLGAFVSMFARKKRPNHSIES